MIYHRRLTTTSGTPCSTLRVVCGLLDWAYGLLSVSEKTREPSHLQTLLQRQHFLLSYFKALSVGPAAVELTTSRIAARCSTN